MSEHNKPGPFADATGAGRPIHVAAEGIGKVRKALHPIVQCGEIGLQSSAQETADGYHRIVAHLCARHRVITCKDGLQWIVQRRKKGGAERSWRGVGYFRTREALIRACASLCARIDPCTLSILAALPEHIGGA